METLCFQLNNLPMTTEQVKQLSLGTWVAFFCILLWIALGIYIKEQAKKVSIEFKVIDTGIGIHENKLVNIFDDFTQAADESSRVYGGTGLGLAIVKKLVELQGGNLWVDSKYGEGSTFGFVLDFKKAEMQIEEKPEKKLEIKQQGTNIKVLVVEDMPLNQLLIKILLTDLGFEFDIVSNGKFAIEKLSQKDAYGLLNKYDIILMDLQMPEMNGYEATDYIRNNMKLDVPIIALTADVTTIDIEKSKSFGMDDYISKPIDEKLLHGKITDCLQKAKRK
jgi:two-component system, chemotaxis family, CheB/CheR fusion protein